MWPHEWLVLVLTTAGHAKDNSGREKCQARQNTNIFFRVHRAILSS